MAGLALTAALIATPSAASADVSTLVSTGSGLTSPMGAVRDNGGAIWVADALLGVCKVDPTLPGGNALVQDGKWCAPAPANGAPPAGPAAAFQMAFDAASSTLFVAEGASNASGIWKFSIDPATSTITDGKKIVFEGDRVFGLALGTDASGQQVLAYSTKRAPLVHLLDNPLTCDPCSPIIAGSAQAKGAAALAFVGTTLYLAETAIGVTRLDNPGPTGGIAQIVAGFPSPLVTALAADPARGRVYAGTTNGNNQDEIDALQLSNGAVETYATGMVGVTALSVDPDGALLVGDDPALSPTTSGNGRLLAVSLGVLGAPRVTFTVGPATFTNHDTAMFAFTGPAGSTFECRLDAAGPADAWTPCGSAPGGSFTTVKLAEGTHALEVRGVSPDPAIGAGPVQRRTFVVDATAPHVTIDNSPADAVLTGATALTMRFSSNEGTAVFACSLDGAVPMPCSDPKALTGLAVGNHVFTVTATDAAGNSSPTAVFAFSVRPAPAPAPPAAPPGDPAPRSAPDAPQDPQVARLSSALRPVSVALIRTRVSLGKLRHGRRVVARLTVPASARMATIALWKSKTAKTPLAVATVRLTDAAGQHVELTLTRRVALRLHSGHYLVGVTLGDGAYLYGPARFRKLTIVR